MKKLKQRFEDDPAFALTVLLAGGAIAVGLLKASAKMIESSAYAYRASKM